MHQCTVELNGFVLALMKGKMVTCSMNCSSNCCLSMSGTVDVLLEMKETVHDQELSLEKTEKDEMSHCLNSNQIQRNSAQQIYL